LDAVPTCKIGLYVLSLKFTSSNDVEVTGYVWQTINKKDLKQKSFGISFPQAVGESVKDEQYQTETEDTVTKG